MCGDIVGTLLTKFNGVLNKGTDSVFSGGFSMINCKNVLMAYWDVGKVLDVAIELVDSEDIVVRA